MSKARRIALAVALAMALVVSLCAAWMAAPRVSIADAATFEAAYESERALPVAQGFVVVEDTTSTEASVVRTIPVAAGECVAIVARTEGASVVAVSLALDEQISETGTLVHIAGCATLAASASLSLAWTRDARFDFPQFVRFTILRGHPTNPRAYARLSSSLEERASFDAAAVRARVVASGGSPTQTATAEPSFALLFPAERATFAALRASSGRRGIAPAVSATEADPFAAPGDVRTAPRVFGVAHQERAIAVVDAGALGGCIAVTLARLDDPLAATPIVRTSIPDREITSVHAVDSAIARDEICTGLFVYSVDPSMAATYEVTIVALDRPAPGVVAASQFGERELAILPIPYLAATREACTTGDAASCFTLAALARDGMDGAGTVRQALEPLCLSAGGDACDVLASTLSRESPTESDTLERRACATGFASACLRRGMRELDAAQDLPLAYGTFQFGCAHGSTDCCSAADTMRQWELASGDAVPDAPG